MKTIGETNYVRCTLLARLDLIAYSERLFRPLVIRSKVEKRQKNRPQLKIAFHGVRNLEQDLSSVP
jgi:hypothetical protein